MAPAAVHPPIHPDTVAQTRDGLLPAESTAELAERFKLLADPGRLRMIYALLGAGELCVRDLAAVVGSSGRRQPPLRQLRLAGLVRTRRDGRTVYYRIADDHVRTLLDVAAAHFLGGHPA